MSDKDDTCTLSDSDLIDKCHQWISDLAESGGKKWALRVPIDMSSDPDMLFAELCDRFTGRRPRRPEHRPENPDGFARRENIFDAIARERMESYELRGFKRAFAALYGVIHSAMQEYADLEVAKLRAEKGIGPETQNADGLSFQNNVGRWMVECFGEEIMTDVIERNYRFFEESLELVQSLGLTKAECLRLVGYVYSRPMGAPAQEVGGVLVTLAALCNASKLNMTDCGAAEINKCWEKIDKIRAKHQSKPQGVRSPLPGYAVESEPETADKKRIKALEDALRSCLNAIDHADFTMDSELAAVYKISVEAHKIVNPL